MKKLRLLMTKTCNRSCSGCCNKDWDLDNLPIADSYSDYEIIMITGGEPLLFPSELRDLIHDLRGKTKATIYVYTAKMDDPDLFIDILSRVDGITLTIHEKEDIPDFIKLCQAINPELIKRKGMRLNVFISACVSNSIIPDWWDYKYINWIPNCPLPENEEFKRMKIFA